MTETTKTSLLSILESKHDEIIDAIYDAEASAMTWLNMVYTVRLWDDGTVEVVERYSGDSAVPDSCNYVDVYTSPVYYDYDSLGDDLSEIEDASCNEIRDYAESLLRENLCHYQYEWYIADTEERLNER